MSANAGVVYAGTSGPNGSVSTKAGSRAVPSLRNSRSPEISDPTARSRSPSASRSTRAGTLRRPMSMSWYSSETS